MATVWAYRVGAFGSNPASGWSHTVNFTSMANLADQLTAAGLTGRVQKLAIVAHGDIPGHVLMDGVHAQPAQSFSWLAHHLTHAAMLEFVSCIAGAGDAGSAFLTSVSTALDGRTIVGYSVWGYLDSSFGAYNDPGNVQASTGGDIPPAGTPRLSPWSDWAKWGHRGSIVRLPVSEQAARPGRTCANPGCPGHGAAGDRCRWEDWVTDATLRRHRP